MRRKEMDGSLKPEPLLVEDPGRFVLFPIQDNEVRASAKQEETIKHHAPVLLSWFLRHTLRRRKQKKCNGCLLRFLRWSILFSRDAKAPQREH